MAMAKHRSQMGLCLSPEYQAPYLGQQPWFSEHRTDHRSGSLQSFLWFASLGNTTGWLKYHPPQGFKHTAPVALGLDRVTPME